MSPRRIGPLAQAWYQWKALRLPWRRRFLVGFDLAGNTFWEFRLTRGVDDSSERWRRIVSCPRTTHHSQVRVSPQWHQWLRHTRRDPPSMEEQRADVVRRARVKCLAAEADARWEAKPRPMDAPREEEAAATARNTDGAKHGAAEAEVEADANDPWAKARAQGPGENWQPTAWSPPAAKHR